MNQLNIKNRFHIYTGFREHESIQHELQAGEAYDIEDVGRRYYIVKMWAFPREVFYLVQNRGRIENYTLFAKKIEHDGEIVFRRPVGFGFVSQYLKKHLEIQFSFPRQRVFMSLFPAQTSVDSLISDTGGVA